MIGEGHSLGAVAEDELGIERMAEFGRHLGSEHDVEEVLEPDALGEGERRIAAVAETLQIGVRRAEHPIATMRIAERDRDYSSRRGGER